MRSGQTNTVPYLCYDNYSNCEDWRKYDSSYSFIQKRRECELVCHLDYAHPKNKRFQKYLMKPGTHNNYFGNNKQTEIQNRAPSSSSPGDDIVLKVSFIDPLSLVYTNAVNSIE